MEINQFLQSRQAIFRGPVGEGMAVEQELSTDELEHIHTWLADGIRAVQSDDRWKFERGRKVSFGLYEGKLSGILYPERTAFDTFINRVFDTLFLAGDKLRRCADFPSCANLYLPRHGRQAYCSERCSQRVRTRKWRVRTRKRRHEHPEKAATLRPRAVS